MTALYGNKFTDMWRGIDDQEVKRCWGDELSAYTVPQITNAVNGLTEKKFPPTLPEFLEMCEATKPRVVSMAHLPAPKYEKVDPEASREARERFMSAWKGQFGNPDTHAWAHKLAERHHAGEKLGIAQLDELKQFQIRSGVQVLNG